MKIKTKLTDKTDNYTWSPCDFLAYDRDSEEVKRDRRQQLVEALEKGCAYKGEYRWCIDLDRAQACGLLQGWLEEDITYWALTAKSL